MSLSASDILPIAIERTAEINTYWNIFIGVATGVLGTMVAGKEIAQNTKVKVLLSVGFALFAASNLEAILALNAQRQALAALLDDPALAGLVKEIRPGPWYYYAIFHAMLDAIVIGAIWSVSLVRKRGKGTT
jgi:hypothetical protein